MSKKTEQDIIVEWLDMDFALVLENMSHEEAHKILNVKVGHSTDELKTAYRLASKKYHPDKGGDPGMMKKVNAAYEKLKSGHSEKKAETAPPHKQREDSDANKQKMKYGMNSQEANASIVDSLFRRARF